MKRSLLSRITSALLVLVLLCAPAARAITPEQAAELLSELYIDEIPQSVLELPTVEEMVDALGDPYTEYFSSTAYTDFKSTMSDTKVVGIGIVCTNTGLPVPSEGILLDRVIDGSPAAQGGLLGGDFILAVDGVSVIGEMLTTVTSRIQGKEGTQVEITYSRDGELYTVTLTRATVVVPATTTELIDGHIGYISCTTFGAETAGHFKEGMEKYGDQADLWIVDLRSNLGGATDAAADAASLFIGKGYSAILRDGAGEYSAFYGSEDMQTLYPVVVLVNEYTASASEIFASDIQSYQAGIVIGSRTYGKGVAQILCDNTMLPEYFPDGDAMKITAFRFFSPLGNTTDQLGVIPELLVPPEYAGDIAMLLHAEPVPDTDNLSFGLRWRWYIDLDQASSEAYKEAFQLLLDALPEDAELRFISSMNTKEKGAPISLSFLCQIYGMEYHPSGFPDSDLSEFSDALSILKTYGLIHGKDDGLYHPQDDMTRAELCQLLFEALNCGWRYDGKNPYSDVDDTAWYAPAVIALSNMGLVKGTGDGKFSPDAPLDHQQFITIMGRLAQFLNTNFFDSAAAMPEDALEDALFDGYAEWSKPFLWLLSSSQKNVFGHPVSILWDDIDEILPDQPTTRDEAAAMLYNLLSYTCILTV